MVQRRKTRAIDGPQGNFLRQAQINRAAWRAACQLQRSADDKPGVVLIFQAMIPFDVLANDGVLIVDLLHPYVTANGSRPAKRPRI